MKIVFIGIGKTKHKFLEEGIERYKKLLQSDVSIEQKYLKESSSSSNSVQDESIRILKAVPAGYKTVLLDIKGKRMTSEKFSSYLREQRNTSVKGLAFLIGGSDGVNDDVRKSADLRLSFSDMTLTHQMVRLFLVEQIYRGYSIINNKKYHK